MSIPATKEQIKILTRDEADEALRDIGQFEDHVAAREKRFNEKMMALKAELVEQCGPVKKTLKKWLKALEKWAAREIPASDSREGPRGVDLNFGRVWFRWTPPAVRFKLEEETVIERLRARGMTSCIRTIESIDKEALAAYDDDMLKSVGAYRDQEERFYYEVKREEVK